MISLVTLIAGLGLPADATDQQVLNAIKGLLGRRQKTPPEELRELTDRRAREKNIPFLVALEEVKRENRKLVEVVGRWYGLNQ